MSNTILRLPALSKKIGLGRSAIYERLDPKSPRHDPTFPRQIHLGMRAIGFLEADAEKWIAAQVEKSRKAG